MQTTTGSDDIHLRKRHRGTVGGCITKLRTTITKNVLSEDADLEAEHVVLEDHEEIMAGLEEQPKLLQILSAPGKQPDQSEQSGVDPSDQLHKRLAHMEQGWDKV